MKSTRLKTLIALFLILGKSYFFNLYLFADSDDERGTGRSFTEKELAKANFLISSASFKLVFNGRLNQRYIDVAYANARLLCSKRLLGSQISVNSFVQDGESIVFTVNNQLNQTFKVETKNIRSSTGKLSNQNYIEAQVECQLKNATSKKIYESQWMENKVTEFIKCYKPNSGDECMQKILFSGLSRSQIRFDKLIPHPSTNIVAYSIDLCLQEESSMAHSGLIKNTEKLIQLCLSNLNSSLQKNFFSLDQLNYHICHSFAESDDSENTSRYREKCLYTGIDAQQEVGLDFFDPVLEKLVTGCQQYPLGTPRTGFLGLFREKNDGVYQCHKMAYEALGYSQKNYAFDETLEPSTDPQKYRTLGKILSETGTGSIDYYPNQQNLDINSAINEAINSATINCATKIFGEQISGISVVKDQKSSGQYISTTLSGKLNGISLNGEITKVEVTDISNEKKQVKANLTCYALLPWVENKNQNFNFNFLYIAFKTCGKLQDYTSQKQCLLDTLQVKNEKDILYKSLTILLGLYLYSLCPDPQLFNLQGGSMEKMLMKCFRIIPQKMEDDFEQPHTIAWKVCKELKTDFKIYEFSDSETIDLIKNHCNQISTRILTYPTFDALRIGFNYSPTQTKQLEKINACYKNPYSSPEEVHKSLKLGIEELKQAITDCADRERKKL